MSYRNSKGRLLAAIAVCALVLTSGGGRAGAEEESGPNSGAFSVNFQNDFTTAYFFRGILQERDGFIWEPSLALNWDLYEADSGVLQGVSLSLGNWNSVHSKDTGNDGSGPASIYESDFYPTLSLSWAGGFTTGLTYYFYTSPNGAFHTTQEADLTLGFDDSPYLGAFALHPSATFAFETSNTSLGSGSGDAVLLQVAPGAEFTIPGAEAYPVSVAMPVVVALSMDDYFEVKASDGLTNITKNYNDTFGYATVGLNATVPLAFVPERYGSWSVINGFNVYFLDDALGKINKKDDVYGVWTSSIAMAY